MLRRKSGWWWKRSRKKRGAAKKPRDASRCLERSTRGRESGLRWRWCCACVGQPQRPFLLVNKKGSRENLRGQRLGCLGRMTGRRWEEKKWSGEGNVRRLNEVKSSLAKSSGSLLQRPCPAQPSWKSEYKVRYGIPLASQPGNSAQGGSSQAEQGASNRHGARVPGCLCRALHLVPIQVAACPPMNTKAVKGREREGPASLSPSRQVDPTALVHTLVCCST